MFIDAVFQGLFQFGDYHAFDFDSKCMVESGEAIMDGYHSSHLLYGGGGVVEGEDQEQICKLLGSGW